MDYVPGELPALISEVEKQGGALLPETCEGIFAVFSSPNGSRTTRVKTCHCGNETMLVCIYDPADDQEQRHILSSRGAGFVRVCAVCDSVGGWPRFEHFADKME